jgi:hypothetical protein
MLNRPIAMALGISIVLAATLAGLAQAQPIADLQPIVGTWEGTLKLSNGRTFPMTLMIREDGTWETLVPGLSPPKFTGTVRLINGKFRYDTKENGRQGTYTLKERDSKRTLELMNDQHTSQAELIPKQ